MRKSFILHIDSLQILDSLTDEQAGQLFKKIYEFHNEEKPKETQKTQSVNSVIDLVFVPFKLQFERDLDRYNNVCERNKNNGKMGGRPKLENPEKPRKPDSKSDSKNDSKNKNNSKNIEERKINFAHTLKDYIPVYGEEMIQKFYAYWSEPNKSQTKFRQEMEKTWDVEGRLRTWASRENKYKGYQKKTVGEQTKDALTQLWDKWDNEVKI